jgi:hypothetical protein
MINSHFFTVGSFDGIQHTQLDLLRFGEQPLSCLPLDHFVVTNPNLQNQIQFEMPFDVSKHPDAQVFVAQKMIERLKVDLKNHEGIVNGKIVTKLCVDMCDLSVGGDEKLRLLKEIETAAKKQKETDLIFVQKSFGLVHRLANALPLIEGAEEQHSVILHHLLSRCSGEEAWVSIEYVIAALVSTKAEVKHFGFLFFSFFFVHLPKLISFLFNPSFILTSFTG